MVRNVVFLLMLASAVASGLPAVVRSFEYDPAHPSQCLVRLSVDVGEEGGAGGAFVISEDWASGAIVHGASWNGVPFAPSRAGTRWRWLFGYGDGNPACAAGLLEYTVVFSSSFAQTRGGACYGMVRSADESAAISGDSNLLDCDGVGGLSAHSGTLGLAPGWNLLWLPRRILPGELDGLELQAMMTLDNASGSYVQLRGNSLPDNVLLWAYLAGACGAKLELSWAQSEELASTAADEARGWRWRSGTARESSAAAGPSWRWKDGRFFPEDAGSSAAGAVFVEKKSETGGVDNE